MGGLSGLHPWSHFSSITLWSCVTKHDENPNEREYACCTIRFLFVVLITVDSMPMHGSQAYVALCLEVHTSVACYSNGFVGTPVYKEVECLSKHPCPGWFASGSPHTQTAT